MNHKKKIGLALAIVALSAVLGITVLRAQGDDDSDSRNLNVFVQGTGDSWLGVDLADVTAQQARDWKLGENYGAVVKSVEPDSPAAKAGLEPGDVIEQFAGQRVHSVAELRRVVGETPSGRVVPIEVLRKGETKTLSATLERRDNGLGPLMSMGPGKIWPNVNMPMRDFTFNFGGPRLGIEVESLTPQLGAYFGVNDGKGVLVREVNEGSAAAKAGLKAGDCIVKLDSTPVESADDLHHALTNRDRGKSQDVTLTIVRDHKQQTLSVHLEAPSRQGLWRPVPDTASNGGPGAADLEAQIFDAQQLAQEAQAMRQEFQSQQDEFQKDADAARAEARQLRDQMQQLQKEKGDWIKQSGPAMQELLRELKRLRDQADSGIV